MENYQVMPVPEPVHRRTSLGAAAQPKLLSWKRPFILGHAVNCDGSFREWSGECGYGIVVRDLLGRFTLAKAKHFHKADLNMMKGEIKYGIMVLMIEMLAIRDGLRLARGLELRHVEIQSDSICIVCGVSSCPKECLGILSEIQFEASFFWVLEFEFVYREAADFLSKFLTQDGDKCFDSLEMPQSFAKIIVEDALGVPTPRFN